MASVFGAGDAPSELGAWVEGNAVLLSKAPSTIDYKRAAQDGQGYLLKDRKSTYRTFLVPLEKVVPGAGSRLLARASHGRASITVPIGSEEPPKEVMLNRLGEPYLVITFPGSSAPDIPSKADIVFPIGRLTSSPSQEVVSLSLDPHYQDYSDLRGPGPMDICGFDPRKTPSISLISRTCWGEVVKRASRRDALDPYSLMPLTVDSLRRLLSLRANESSLFRADLDAVDGSIDHPFEEITDGD